MKLQKGIIEFNNRIIISYWQQWYELFRWKRFNWNNFDLLHIGFENDIMCGAYEFIFVFFLLGITIRIPHKTEKSEKFWKTTNSTMKKLEQSCYGWVNKETYKKFRTNNANYIQVDNIKSKRRTKKIFIQ